MSEIKTLKENLAHSLFWIKYKILKLKDVYKEFLIEVTCNL